MQPLGPQQQRGCTGRPVATLELKPAAGLELARRGDAAVEERAAPDEPRDKAIGWTLVEVALRADLPDFTLGHHHQPVGDGERLLLVMRHHDGGQSELALQFADLDAHLFAQLGIEVGQGLVEEQHIRPDRERAGERDTLLLPAGQLARQPRRITIELHEPQRFARACLDLGFRKPAHLQPERDVVGDRHVRKQRIALEYHAGVAPPWRQPRHVRAADAHCAAARLDKARDHAQRRRLAAAGWPKQHEKLAIRHIERHAGDHRMIAVAFREVDQLEPRHGHTTCEIFT